MSKLINNYTCRFFSPERTLSNNSRLRWSTLNVHQLDTVIERFRIENVLEALYDRRLTRIENLSKTQLVEECKKASLKHTGLKYQLIERLFKYHGIDHMVSNDAIINKFFLHKNYTHKLRCDIFQIIDSRKDIGSADDHQTYLDIDGIQVSFNQLIDSLAQTVH